MTIKDYLKKGFKIVDVVSEHNHDFIAEKKDFPLMLTLSKKYDNGNTANVIVHADILNYEVNMYVQKPDEYEIHSEGGSVTLNMGSFDQVDDIAGEILNVQ